jgi:hypothetical protein
MMDDINKNNRDRFRRESRQAMRSSQRRLVILNVKCSAYAKATADGEKCKNMRLASFHKSFIRNSFAFYFHSPSAEALA